MKGACRSSGILRSLLMLIHEGKRSVADLEELPGVTRVTKYQDLVVLARLDVGYFHFVRTRKNVNALGERVFKIEEAVRDEDDLCLIVSDLLRRVGDVPFDRLGSADLPDRVAVW